MGSHVSRVNKNKVIASDVIIAKSYDDVLIELPSVFDRPIKFFIEYDAKEPTYTEYEDKDFENLYVKVVTKLREGPLVFDATGTVGDIKLNSPYGGSVYFNYVVNFVGKLDDFVYILTYNIVRVENE
ncbi:hypothetical protein MKK67_11400 [Methylobacterium sp. J-072]|uniref:hypothetical protein n=1 Tax=Methylobacterium sp. J-072 TaxID=2836651 RepID=UPI001FB8E6D3|nr:hypothetical protein [Methylobacterium sp. J-072]MCJ2093100.1 hypothetical protein [Methylobacterium sp. J-072]